MKGIKYQLLGIALILFGFCPFMLGIAADNDVMLYVGMIIHVVGLITAFNGFDYKDKD